MTKRPAPLIAVDRDSNYALTPMAFSEGTDGDEAPSARRAPDAAGPRRHPRSRSRSRRRPVMAEPAERRNGTAPAESPAVDSPAPPTYWSADDLARELRIHKSTIFRLAQRDPTMPQLRLGNLVRFPRERVLRWLRRREGRPA
jgi:excisionase family DNA binding protein